MSAVTSKDGTKIAFDKVGSGPAVILVNGAMAYRRAFDPTLEQLAELLGKQFTVYDYDRRGRGESGDTRPFSKEREIEDLQALVEDAGGEGMVLGFSSGSAVALDAAAVSPGIVKVAVYEAPFIVDDSRQPVPTDYAEQLMKLGSQGKREEAVEYFLTHAVGIPAENINGHFTTRNRRWIASAVSITSKVSSEMCSPSRPSNNRVPLPNNTGTRCIEITSMRPSLRSCCATFAPDVDISLSPANFFAASKAASTPSTNVYTPPLGKS